MTREVIQYTDRLVAFAPEKDLDRIANGGYAFKFQARWDKAVERLNNSGADLSKIKITTKEK